MVVGGSPPVRVGRRWATLLKRDLPKKASERDPERTKVREESIERRRRRDSPLIGNQKPFHSSSVVEQSAVNRSVVGSSPTCGAMLP